MELHVSVNFPFFFRPFRSLNSASMTPTWWRVTKLEPGQVYEQGNINDFIHMTGWKGSSVLYFGDHVFSDLAVRYPVFVLLNTCIYSGGLVGRGGGGIPASV